MTRLFCFLLVGSFAVASLSGCGGQGGNVNDGASQEEIKDYKAIFQKELDAQAEMEALANESGAGG